MQRTWAAALVLTRLSDAKRGQHGGWLIRQTGLPSGNMYPLLRRLEANGMVTGEWGKPALSRTARYYVLTEAGEEEATAIRDAMGAPVALAR